MFCGSGAGSCMLVAASGDLLVSGPVRGAHEQDLGVQEGVRFGTLGV